MSPTGWEFAGTPPGALESPDGLDALSFVPAVVPGTVAAALGPDVDLDGRDWWYRARLAAPAVPSELVLDGLATYAEVFLDDRRVLVSESMFARHRIPLDLERPPSELAICFRALRPRLAERRRPRARWRTALVDEGHLRFVRTMLLGRAPGFAPGPAVVGPWRPVEVRPLGPVVETRLRARLAGDDGVLCAELVPRTPVSELTLQVRTPTGETVAFSAGPQAGHDGRARLCGELRIPGVARWWPHTHGAPALHEVTLDGERLGRVGFRSLQWPADWERSGLALRINDVPVFCRGAVWTPLSLERPDGSEGELRRSLEEVADAGLNMLRVPGIGCYESDAFHDLCDELGILVWQDFMFANLDYPDTDPGFVATVAAEARSETERLAGRPSLAVLCGGSECAQQVTMLGLDPALARGPLYTEILPAAVAEAGADVPYVPNAPWGGDVPFRPGPGVANYYGVGAYLRPLADARQARVGFAAECLAFSNVPDEETLEATGLAGGGVSHHPRWKAGVPRDAGAGWDFEDIRDHYLELLYGVRAAEVRWSDPARYRELGRAVSGEVMAEAMGEWRRGGSTCAGALVLWLRDLAPGAGWGLVDASGRPKAALHHLRRALAPVAVWTTDEGLDGIGVHLANDGPEPIDVGLRIALYREGEMRVEEIERPVNLKPHGGESHNLEGLLGRFVDVGWSYRFGPPAQDLVVASLERATAAGPTEVLSQAVRFPVGRPTAIESAATLGLTAQVTPAAPGGWALVLSSRRVVHGVRVHTEGWRPADDAFTLEPGRVRTVALLGDHDRAELADAGGDTPPTVHLTALNLRDRVHVEGPR